MGRGDAVCIFATAPAGSTLSIRPAAGTEIMVTAFGSNKWSGTAPNMVPNIGVRTTDGTLVSHICEPGGATIWRYPKIFIHHHAWLHIFNHAGVAASIFICGVRIK